MRRRSRSARRLPRPQVRRLPRRPCQRPGRRPSPRWARQLAHVGKRRLEVGEAGVASGGDVVGVHEFLAERLAAFQLGTLASGPNVGTPAARSTSATPATNGASGPMTTKSMAFSRTNASTAWPSSGFRSGTFWAMPSVPPLPGATYRLSVRGDFASAHAMACSRPPPPNTKMFMSGPFKPSNYLRRAKALQCCWCCHCFT